MDRKSTRQLMLLLVTVVACWASTLGRPFGPTAGWHLSVEMAQVRVSIGTDRAAVRDRTALFENGQVLRWLGLAG